MTQIQRKKLSKAELELEAKEKGIVSTSKYTKQELIDMLDELESTKETVKKQQEEIEELKNKFAEHERRTSEKIVTPVKKTPVVKPEFKYYEFWRKYVILTAIIPWFFAFPIAGWYLTYFVTLVIALIVWIPVIFYWPFSENYGRHYGMYLWSWYTLLTQIISVIVVIFLCTIIIGFFLIPSAFKFNISIYKGRLDRNNYRW